MLLKPKNWAVFQHYKDRCPPWIKLHRDLLNDRKFMRLPIASKAIAPLLWLLASESKDGVFDGSLDELVFRLHISPKEYQDGVKPLIDNEFFIIASIVLADSKQTAIPETETEREKERETELDAYASLSADGLPTCPHQEILLLYKKHLPHLTQPRVWEGSRQTNMRQRWRQAAKPSNYSPEGYKTLEDGLKWWDSFFGYIANDSTLAQGFRTKDRNWQPDLEWIVNATNFAKIIDGKYSK
jgi:hypothetical protein